MKEGGSRMWINERTPEGTYVITFRTVSPRGEVEISQEYGIWGLSADIYFTKMLGWIKSGQKFPHSGVESYYDDAYTVKVLTADDFVYEAVTTKELFRVRKVSDAYELPSNK